MFLRSFSMTLAGTGHSIESAYGQICRTMGSVVASPRPYPSARPRELSRALACLVITLFALGATRVETRAENSGNLPNIIFISLDTTRADHLSLYGYPLTTSPNLDRFAGRALVFENARTVVPLTGPAHASLFTGLYPHQHGAFRNGVPLKETWTTFAEGLQRHGYSTAAFLSGWTLRKKICGLDQGFAHYDDTFPKRYKLVNRERLAEDTTAAVEAFLEKQPLEPPFFLFVHYFDPHDPYRVHPGIYESLETQARDLNRRPSTKREKKVLAYDNEIAYMDGHLGRLLRTLRGTGLLEESVVLIFSDHGENLGEHDYWGHGRKVYEQNLHIPLILHAPQWFKEGKRLKQSVTLMDILPTLFSLMGVPLPSGQGMEGRDLSGYLLHGEPLPPDRLYFETFKGTLKRFTRIVAKKIPRHPLYVGFIEGPVKTILDPESSELEIYDLASDPDESENLASQLDSISTTSHILSWFQKSLNPEPVRVKLSREQIEQLKSLGYID